MSAKLCNLPVTHIITWPDGRQLRCCHTHAPIAIAILNAMEHAATVTVLPNPADDGCTQHVAQS